MNYPDITERKVQRAEELVSWACGERLPAYLVPAPPDRE